MARRTTPLTATEVKSVKPKNKDFKLFDGGGLYLLVTKSGGKHWKLKYRMSGKEKKVSLGAYPAISLSDARVLREKYKSEIAKQIDPNEKKKQAKEELRDKKIKIENTFYKVSKKWLKSYASQVSESYHTRLGRALDNYVYPTIKHKPMNEVTRLKVIAIMEDLKNRDLHETARRTLMLLNKIYKYAVTHELTPHNIIADIEVKDVLGKKVKKHYPSFTKEKDIKGLLLSIDDYTGDYFTKMALRVLPYVFVRSYNIRHMEWKEINFKTQEWVIPAVKMKIKEEFTLPLAKQVIDLLKEVEENRTDSAFVFPSFRSDGKPLSDNTLISAFRRMGYTKEEFVPHGFRSMFSTIAYENANDSDGHGMTGEVIEACLAHKEPNQIKGAYNRAEYKEAKRKVFEWYADYLDNIKNNKIL